VRELRSKFCLQSLLLLCLTITVCFSQVTPQSVHFDPARVNGDASAQALRFSFQGLSATPTFQLHSALDYSLGTPACDSTFSTCNLPVLFTPKLPGLRQDAISVRDSNGALLASTFLSGVGLGSQLSFTPGMINEPYVYPLIGTLAANYLCLDAAGTYMSLAIVL
jgi:hypothetical protein